MKYTFTRSNKGSLGKLGSKLSGKVNKKDGDDLSINKDNSKFAQLNSKNSTKFSNSK